MKPALCKIMLVLAVTLAACAPAPLATAPPDLATPTPDVAGPTPLPVRTPHPPGEVFDYAAQQGDTLPAVAAHFHTSEREILAANPDLPAGITTLPPGYPLRVPAYYLPLIGSPFHILPDSEVVNGPGAVGFDTQAEITTRPGFLAGMTDYANSRQRPAWEIVDIVAIEYLDPSPAAAHIARGRDRSDDPPGRLRRRPPLSPRLPERSLPRVVSPTVVGGRGDQSGLLRLADRDADRARADGRPARARPIPG